MSPEDLRLLDGGRHRGRGSAAGKVLIERGQPGAGLYVVLEGTVIVEAT